ncbi:type II toxin-antitoxin system death-on-curing family toxin [Schinkia azotoformans]|uniref:type II toxin-antitoxin system death-on-curing family toxin n=1 Tax=Schinkia azotoformans TaxID=1454 RepID=UPI002DBFD14A|nr:type II toxin-antitoxin system death-on-curing family toxin [Schinkia azotoformans]MEC1697747.1 type II toxin-antitoxin system death-on-curing family toxin [Schinkia azotoformans]
MIDDYLFLDPEDIRYLHDEAIDDFGGLYGEHESGMIDYMAEKPFQYSYGQELFPDLFLKAAVYLHGFATHQYFVDGNKRTGVKCCITFLLINGYEITVEDEHLELYYVAKKVANKRMDIDDIAKWLKENSIRNLSYL